MNSTTLQTATMSIEQRLKPIAEHLGIDGSCIEPLGSGTALHLFHEGDTRPVSSAGSAFQQQIASELDDEGFFLLHLPGSPTARELSAWRNLIWPELHVVRIYRKTSSGFMCETAHSSESCNGEFDFDTILVARKLTTVQRRQNVIEKFDANADGWNGQPGTPGWKHHRWMRRYVGCFCTNVAPPTPGEPLTILDYGSGAGWVGIEAALLFKGARLSAFDPSPALCEHTRRNAEACGLSDVDVREGFGEDPPFDGMFDLVISSGVLSYSPAQERFLDSLVERVAPGGTLVIGDLSPESFGMRSRMNRKPLLPVRELNGRPRAWVRRELEQRGMSWNESAAYQLTTPVPELMHKSGERLGGALNGPLLWANQIAGALHRTLPLPRGLFDSYVMHFTR